MSDERLKPKDQNRLKGIDLARFVALVGMVIVNFNVVMVAPEAEETFSSQIAESLQGRAAATFVVLAGIGLGLGTKRDAWNQTLKVTLKRAAFLLVVGLLNSLIFEADIIHYYAFYFLFGVLLLRAPGWCLVVTMSGLIVGFVGMILFFNYDAGWNWQTYSYHDFWTLQGFVRNLFFNGWHPVIPWLAFLLFGILLSRLNLGSRSVQRKLFIGGATAFALISASSYWLVKTISPLDAEAAILFSTAPVPPMPFYMLAGGSIACTVIGFCLLVESSLKRAHLLNIFTAAGRQTLTLYIVHIIIGMGTLDALGMLGTQTSQASLLAALAFCVLATIYAVVWMRFFKHGPLELLMRKVAG
ncbi:DUF418 domain-containing protein [Gimesia aquarii]|nr:DUF418 domain-containing protein [Gimesia aquarii]